MMSQKRCFVIQPFDEATYEKRYRDIFKPAIKDADIEPYRVDKDRSADVIISAIEEGIEKSDLCFAEITADNPNVWYELGYANAQGKPVIMVCNKGRKLPFDIRHRRIIQYEGDSISDFENLKKEITDSIKKVLNKISSITKLTNPVSISSKYEMPPYILTTLVIIVSNYDRANNQGVSFDQINKEMNQAGFNALASRLAIRQLTDEAFLYTEYVDVTYYEGDSYGQVEVMMPTDKAIEWLLQNQDDLDFSLSSV